MMMYHCDKLGDLKTFKYPCKDNKSNGTFACKGCKGLNENRKDTILDFKPTDIKRISHKRVDGKTFVTCEPYRKYL